MNRKILLSAVLASCAAPATAADFSLSSGVGYTVGDYGESGDTEVLSAPLDLQLQSGRLRLTASIPYLRVESPANVIGGGQGPIFVDPTPPSTPSRLVREGFGDLVLGASYALARRAPGGLAVELSGRVKLPTASTAKALGTGKTDMFVALDVARPSGVWTPFMTVGYLMSGDPAGYDLRNSLAASAGTVVRLSDRVRGVLAYDYAQAVSAGIADSHALFGGLSGPLASKLDWTLYGSAGLSEGSPDAGGGLRLTLRL